MRISNSENLVSLSQATQILPVLGDKNVHPSTLWRWCRRGLNGTKLDYLRMGRRIFTSAEALDRFFTVLAEKDVELLPPLHKPKPSSDNRTKKRVSEIDAAEQTLDREGV